MRIIGFALAFVLVAAASATDAVLPISGDELLLAGVALGDSEVVVLSKIGPMQRSEHPDNYLTIQLESAGLKVALDPQGGVGEITSNRPEHCTPSGICSGMVVDRIPGEFGRPTITDQKGSRYTAQYATTTDCWLELIIHAGLVESVRIACPV